MLKFDFWPCVLALIEFMLMASVIAAVGGWIVTNYHRTCNEIGFFGMPLAIALTSKKQRKSA